MHKYPPKQSSVGPSGQTLTINVSMTQCNCGTFVTKPMSYVAALHLVPNQIRSQIPNQYGPYARCTLDKGVAFTKGGGYPNKEIGHPMAAVQGRTTAFVFLQHSL